MSGIYFRAHVCSDEEYEELQAAGAFEEDAVGWAEDVFIVERIKGLLFPRSARGRRDDAAPRST